MKKVTQYMKELGRVVAFHPGLKKITDSTTASILLSQFLYWSDKMKDGWIWKSSEELEEETGLTKWEQITAKRILVERGLIIKEVKRLDHTTRYKVNRDKIDELWEEASTPKEEETEEITETPKSKYETKDIPVYDENNELVGTRRTALAKKGDMVDGMLYYAQQENLKKEEELFRIKSKIEEKFSINAEGSRWEKFIEFAYNREKKAKEKIEVFLDWALNEEGFNPVYWTPEKMKMLYPQAFLKPKRSTDNFPSMDDYVEKEVAPMPKDIGIKKNLY